MCPMASIAQRVPPSAGVLEALDERSCILHTGSHSLDEITIHLSPLGVDFQVHEPPELVDYIRQLTDRLGRAIA